MLRWCIWLVLPNGVLQVTQGVNLHFHDRRGALLRMGLVVDDGRVGGCRCWREGKRRVRAEVGRQRGNGGRIVVSSRRRQAVEHRHQGLWVHPSESFAYYRRRMLREISFLAAPPLLHPLVHVKCRLNRHLFGPANLIHMILWFSA